MKVTTEMTPDQLLALAEKAEIFACDLRLVTRDIQNPTDRDYALRVAREAEQRAWVYRKLAWGS
jgi:hypothetical protein